MLISIEAEYKAGGYPMHTHYGLKKFAMNVSDDETIFNIENNARERAQREVAKDEAFALESVTITKVRMISLN